MNEMTTTAPTIQARTSCEMLSRYLDSLAIRPASRQVYRGALRSYAAYLQGGHRNGSRADVVAYRQHLLDTGHKPATVNAYLTAIRAAYKAIAITTGQPSPVEDIPSVRRPRGFSKGHLEPDQMRALLDASRDLSLRDFAIISVLSRALLRTVEVIRLNVGDYTWRNGRRILRVWGKGHDDRDSYVLVSDKLREALDAYLAERGPVTEDEPLFVSTSHHNQGGRLTTRSIRRISGGLLRSVGIDDPAITTHSLRHTGAVQLLEAGASILDIQQVLRHESVKTTEIYLESIRDRRRMEQFTEQKLDAVY